MNTHWFAILVLSTAPCLAQTLPKAITAKAAVRQMGRGINLGNTLEAPREGAWNNPPAEEYYFADIKKAGFTWVKIPIQWGEHLDTNAPYKIDAAWLDRVEQVVDWGLSQGLFVSFDAHHEQWIKEHYQDPAARERFDSLWRQISERFKNKSPKLIFELLHDPVGMTKEDIDDSNARILKIIRATQPTRLVAISSHVWPTPDVVLDAAVPKDDYVLGTVYLFYPPTFTFEGQGTWGTDEDKAAIKGFFDRVAGWSEAHHLPVALREFGATSKADGPSRLRYYRFCVEEAVRHGIPFAVWDNGADFEVYRRSQREWNELLPILIHAGSPASSEAPPVPGDQ